MAYPPINTKVWSCVGSAGVVDVADINKVDFVGSVVKLHGIEIGNPVAEAAMVEPPPGVAERRGEVAAPRSVPTQAVIRFGVTPNLFSAGILYQLNLFGKCGSGQIDARLIWVVRPQINTPVGLTELPLVSATVAAGYPHVDPNFFVLRQSDASFGGGDMVDDATYYVEATLSASSRIESTIINPPQLAVVEIVIAEP
jgi:hypothetical protein